MSADGGRSEGLSWEVVLSAVPDALLLIDQGSRIVFANAAAKRLFDRTESSLLGTRASELVAEQDADLFAELQAKALKAPALGPTGHRAELEIRRPDGSRAPVELELGKAGGSRGEPLVICSLRDVAVRRAAGERQARLEASLNQSKRLEAIGQLAGGVAHDFNNLLAVILNYATFVAEDLPPDSPMLEDLAEIRRAAERGASLTRQLLIFSRRDVTNPEIVDLNATIRNLEKLLRRTVGEHIALKIALAPDLWEVEVDPAQIEQALLNLVLNARDAMPGGGVLTIETENAELDEIYTDAVPEMDPGAYVRVTIADTGPGIARDEIEHIFEPFYTTKPRAEGTGLGLAAVHGIVTAAGGHISVYSEAGFGTAFKIHLPLAGGVAVERARDETGEHRWRTGTVLVVEDEPSVLQMALRVLERAGNAVLGAADGPSALELLEARGDDVDVVLADVVMPMVVGPGARRMDTGAAPPPPSFLFAPPHPKKGGQAGGGGGGVVVKENPHGRPPGERGGGAAGAPPPAEKGKTAAGARPRNLFLPGREAPAERNRRSSSAPSIAARPPFLSSTLAPVAAPTAREKSGSWPTSSVFPRPDVRAWGSKAPPRSSAHSSTSTPRASQAIRAVSSARTLGLARQVSISIPSEARARPAALAWASPFGVNRLAASSPSPSSASPCRKSQITSAVSRKLREPARWHLARLR